MTETATLIARQIAQEIGAKPAQVVAAVDLLDGGATVPFVARYRKEATGGLDDTQLRTLSERLGYLREMEGRRASILEEIAKQGKLTPALDGALRSATTKAQLEDLYLPYRPKRRTKATIARENGLEPLALAILARRGTEPEELAQGHVTDAVPDTRAALDGAREIIAEGVMEDAALRGQLRRLMQARALLCATVEPGKEQEGAKFSDYFAHSEPWAKAPSHRVLAMMRGRTEGVLNLDLMLPDDAAAQAEGAVAGALAVGRAGPGDLWLGKAAGWIWRIKLKLALTLDLMADLRDRAETEAITVFARNLKDLLLAAPAGQRTAMGLDPGVRTGVKVAVVDATGKLLETATVYPFAPRFDVAGTKATLAVMARKHGVELIAIGNGTASRETDALVAEMLAQMPAPRPQKVTVSEAGASVYSASELAAREFPGLDVSLRGAVSIARRLQDPLAELVKIEPKAIGVGQYQHDLNQSALGRSLDAVVEDAVNAVGVELNTASAPLLARVSGLGATLAEAIVAHRDAHGPFASRKELLKVTRLGPRAFEQAAGFLRIQGGAEPLDASAVHPEAYALARRIVKATGRDVASLMRAPDPLRGLDPQDFTDATFGLPTVQDILRELEKPGRDPRPAFRTATFADGVNTLSDLKPGMSLEGTVTNVAAFGAFVDIGVHQDGLVHVSQLADRFIKDPHEVVKAGDVVRVRVVEVDMARKRIALTMRSDQPAAQSAEKRAPAPKPAQSAAKPAPAREDLGGLGAALRDAMRKGR